MIRRALLYSQILSFRAALKIDFNLNSIVDSLSGDSFMENYVKANFADLFLFDFRCAASKMSLMCITFCSTVG